MSKRLLCRVETKFHNSVNAKTRQTGVPFSEVARRYLARWVEGGELPPKAEESEATKDSQLPVVVGDALYRRILSKSRGSKVGYAEVVRRGLARWVETGEMPASSKKLAGRRGRPRGR